MTPLSVATLGLLDRGTKPALEIAVLGFLREGGTPPAPVARGDAGGSSIRQRRKYRFKVRDELAALLSPKEPAKAAPPPPTAERVEALQQAIVGELAGLLGPAKSVEQFVAQEVQQIYQPGIDWRAFQAAIGHMMQLAAEQLEQEIEEEDEFLMMVS